jgi:THO complex subunit 3
MLYNRIFKINTPTARSLPAYNTQFHNSQNIQMDPPSTFNPSSLFDARSLVIVITGGGTGIGRAMASALFHAGAARIYLLGRRAAVLAAAAAAIESTGGGEAKLEGNLQDEGKVIVPLECDVGSPESVRAAAAEVARRDGLVDVLINNAGIPGPDNRGVHAAGVSNPEAGVAAVRDVLLHDWNGWADTFAINTSAVMLVAANFLPLLEAANVRRGWEAGRVERGPPQGHVFEKEGVTPPARKRSPVAGVDADDDRMAQIVTVASAAAFNRHVTLGFAYAASKAAAVYLGKSLAYTLAPWGIRSNMICPGCKFRASGC